MVQLSTTGVDGMSDEWKAPEKAENSDDKSWKLLEKTLLASVQEQRRARRWGIFFKLLTFVWLIAMLALGIAHVQSLARAT